MSQKLRSDERDTIPFPLDEVEPADDAHVERWRTREEAVLQRVDQIMAWHKEQSDRYRRGHYATKLTVMVCSVLAPLSIASGATQNITVIGVSRETMTLLSLLITVTLGLVEGSRSIFRFEQRWRSFYSTAAALFRAKENYIDSQIDTPAYSDAWKENYAMFRAEIINIVDGQNEFYFRTVLEQEARSASVETRP